jgi:uncharacterized protein YgbK (DUF1537 family)
VTEATGTRAEAVVPGLSSLSPELSGGLVVLDDDPTGTQAATGVPVIIDPSATTVARWTQAHPPGGLYVSTNTRALSPEAAAARLRSVVTSVRQAWPDARFLLRGDSTLRAHMAQDFFAVRQPGTEVLALVPAMPASGRVTVGGEHYLVRDGVREPLSATEYSQDPVLSYRCSHLLGWAEERSAGYFPRRSGIVVDIAALREQRGAAVQTALAAAVAKGTPVAVAVDALTAADLEVIADGLRTWLLQGLPFIVRCAPPLAALLAGCPASRLEPPPAGSRRVLVVAGSFVATTTRQLAALDKEYPGSVVFVDLEALSASSTEERRRLTTAVAEAWTRGPVAGVATPRGRPEGPDLVERGLWIASELSQLVAQLRPAPDVVVAKGGVTSAVVASGIGEDAAWVVGPVAPGIALWDLGAQSSPRWLVILAGNVGNDQSLSELVGQLEAA